MLGNDSERSPVCVADWEDDEVLSAATWGTQLKARTAAGGKRSVKFADHHNEIFWVEGLDELSDEEYFAIWYSEDEYGEIKASNQLTVFIMENGQEEGQEELGDLEHCPRGLEAKTHEGAYARFENKKVSRNAVLDEQDRQWKVNRDDFEKLRAIYKQHSKLCIRQAMKRALQDAQAAERYQQEAIIVD